MNQEAVIRGFKKRADEVINSIPSAKPALIPPGAMMQRMNTGLKIEHNDTRLLRDKPIQTGPSFISNVQNGLSHIKDTAKNWFGGENKGINEIDNFLKPMGNPSKNKWLFNGIPDASYNSWNKYQPSYSSNIRIDNGLGNNSLIVNAHGGGGVGDFNYQPDPEISKSINSSLLSSIKNPDTLFNLEDIAKKIGPATNNIHNFYSGACNLGGGCTPELVHKYFPNATNINITPPGSVNLFAEGKGQNAKDIRQTFLEVNKRHLPSRLDTIMGNIDRPYAKPVHHYTQDGTNWINRGPYINVQRTNYFKDLNKPSASFM